MDLRGEWRNQYGSILSVAEDDSGRLAGRFRTALEDSGFYGQDLAIVGVRCGEALSFAFASTSGDSAQVCSFTGRIVDGRLETVWHVVTTAKPWPHAVATNADTFERAN